MKLRADEDAIEMIPETKWERECLRRIAAFREIRLDINTNSAADSSAWPEFGPTASLVFDLTPPAGALRGFHRPGNGISPSELITWERPGQLTGRQSPSNIGWCPG